MMLLDLAIIGAGPAGIACALQAAREGLSLMVFTEGPPGGLVAAARRIDNLPGFPGGIAGRDLGARLTQHLEAAGVQVARLRVLGLSRRPGEAMELELPGGGACAARAVCLATGTVPVALPEAWRAEPGSVARDVRGLPESLHGSTVAVVGGGEAALDSALSVADRGGRPVVLVRGAAVKACSRLVGEVRARGVEVRTGACVAALARAPERGFLVSTGAGGAGMLRADHVLACLGRQPALELLAGLWPEGDSPRGVATLVPGLFLAGDVIHGAERYVATALGDGQAAALRALEWLRGAGH
jgi:thioredoxin reductase (NADPH)